MKNRKGFTLVELLAVIVVLGIIVIVAAPNILGSLNNGKTTLSRLEKKGIEDAAESLVLDVISCDNSNFLYRTIINNLRAGNEFANCGDVVNYLTSNQVNLSIQDLKNNKYMEDDSNRCSGELTLTVDSNYKVTVDTNQVTCG